MWEMTVVSVVGFALLGLVTSSAAAGETRKPLRRRWDVVGRVVLGVAGLFVILAQAVSLLANREILASQRAAGRDDLAAAVKRAETPQDRALGVLQRQQLALLREGTTIRRCRMRRRSPASHRLRLWGAWARFTARRTRPRAKGSATCAS